MPIAPGTRLGPYEIQSAIGAGGMGEVYRAKDTRLDRTVAIKVLPAHFSSDLQKKQRFEREARTISSLSHPHICSLFDIGHQDETDFLVMEYLEGETLVQRLNKGPMPNDQVLRYGVQIAEALDKAHRQNIVHRDLKPGNIMITKSGAKLLDFGLAKLQEVASVPSADSQMMTKDGPLTDEGMVVGTVQYMAPEQLEGGKSDDRTDIFALGEVLYEMATGKKPFSGNSKASLISSILTAEPPPISAHQPLVSPALEHVVKKCLAKDPEERWQNARDVASELKWISEATSQSQITHAAPRRAINLERYFWIFLVSALAALSLYLYQNSKIQNTPLLKLQVIPQADTRLNGQMAVSKDGTKIAFIARTANAQTELWVRPFDSLQAKRLPGTQDATSPFWSPDGKFIGFFAQGKLKKIDVNEGPPQILAEAPVGRGGAWSPDGIIVFAPNFTGHKLLSIPAEGGKTTEVSGIDNSGSWPSFLPDGKHFLYSMRSLGGDGIAVGSIDSTESQLLLKHDKPTRAEFVPPGYLLVAIDGNLIARRFDPKTFQLAGGTTPVAENIGFDGSYYSFSASEKGVVAYSNVDLVSSQITIFDRSGKLLAPVGVPGGYIEPYLSPDERRLVVGRTDPAVGYSDLWIVEFERQTFTRFTFGVKNKYASIWSPDGKIIIFSTNQNTNNFDLFQKPSSGAGDPQVLLHSDQPKFSDDWSRDGKFIVFETEDPKTKYDLWFIPMTGDRKPTPYLQTEFNEAHATFSSDGNWIAYASDEIGISEVYVRRFPNAGAGKWQVSSGGGDQPVWSRDGRELFYMAPNGVLMAVEVNMVNETFEAGSARPLFQTGVTFQPLIGADRNQYQVFSDGQRFLVNTLPGSNKLSPITVLFNWTEALKK